MKLDIAKYWKTIVAVVGAAIVIGNSVVAAVSSGYGDGTWDASDTTATVVALITALGVYLKANKPA